MASGKGRRWLSRYSSRGMKRLGRGKQRFTGELCIFYLIFFLFIYLFIYLFTYLFIISLLFICNSSLFYIFTLLLP